MADYPKITLLTKIPFSVVTFTKSDGVAVVLFEVSVQEAKSLLSQISSSEKLFIISQFIVSANRASIEYGHPPGE